MKKFGKRIGNFFKTGTKEAVMQNYEIGGVLGRGNFAVVKECTDREGHKWAIKILDKTSKEANLDMMKREVEIMQMVEHRNIIYMREMYDTPTKLYLIMELVTGGEMFDRIVNRGNYSEKDASDVVRQIANAVAYLHELGIVHRDLKPENLLYANERDDSDIKIADFGLSRVLNEDSMLKTACGTPGYVAPEVLKGRGYGKPVDMWSVGVITYILLCGFPPFYDDNVQVLFEQIKAGHYDFPDQWWGNISESAKDLIRKLLTVDPAKRLTAVEALQHPWLTGETASTSHLPDTLKSMKSFNARRKFKMAVIATIATNRIKGALDSEA
eukprot:TRINITY_DN580_c0_g1_i2.p1 TRINITY_DN580_c0_g1~~TRINITY_DN580_c0_g1_i2.p1  ORF type:complete len:336 (-),score=80.65 TRINITY_DN580_c0_g1_i2:706-1686(-)